MFSSVNLFNCSSLSQTTFFFFTIKKYILKKREFINKNMVWKKMFEQYPVLMNIRLYRKKYKYWVYITWCQLMVKNLFIDMQRGAAICLLLQEKIIQWKIYHIKKPTIIQGSKYNEMVPVHDIKLNFINWINVLHFVIL